VSVSVTEARRVGARESRRLSFRRLEAASMGERLLDFTQPFDVPLLDATVAVFYGASSTEEVRTARRFE
jgi:hypothetical protein